MNHLHRNQQTKGVTLIELLVVVTILMLLAAVAIPAIRPLTEGRRIREAARAIDVFITQAKIRAAEIQRPVGILFERIKQTDITGATVYQDDACNILRLVEVPPPYAGEFYNSRVRLQRQADYGGFVFLQLQIAVNDFSNGLLRVGDRIQFNYQGPVYTIDASTSFVLDASGFLVFFDANDSTYAADTAPGDGWIDTQELVLTTPASELGDVPWSTSGYSSGVPFQIHRQPQPSPIPPLRLPKNTVVDLADSGYYIGGPDQDTSTANIVEGSDHYSAPSADVRYAFESYEYPAGEFSVFPDAFGRVGVSGSLAADNHGPMILFAPNGAIRWVYHFKAENLPADLPGYGPHRVIRPIFLLVGKWERTGHETITGTGTTTDLAEPVRSLADDQLHNWQDASNIWMAIGPHNGMVTSARVNAPAPTTTGLYLPGDPEDTDRGNLGQQMQISRALAREAQISKGALAE